MIMNRAFVAFAFGAAALLGTASSARAAQAAVSLSGSPITIQQGSQGTLTATFTISGTTGRNGTPAISFCDTLTLNADGTFSCTPGQLALNAGQKYTVNGAPTTFTRPITVVVGNDVPCGQTYTGALTFSSSAGTGLDFGDGILQVSINFEVIVTCPPALIAEGCGHGFWKNHASLWPAGYDENVLSDFFTLGGDFAPLANESLMEAMNFTGPGNTVYDAGRLLLQQAVAALLNADVLGPTFAYTHAEVTSGVASALASTNRSTILTLKDQFDTANNTFCPLPR